MADGGKEIKVRAYNFSLAVIKEVRKLKFDVVSSVLIKQLIRSSTSIGANLVEGRNSNSDKEFLRFLEISLKSANESIYWICLLRDSEIMSKIKANELITENKEIANIIASIIIKLRKK
jgi:four helix bundle protein